MATTSLQNINWLPASKKVWAAYVKEKTSVVTVYIPSPYNGFLYFLEGQVHKDNKLGIMTNMSKSRLAKVISTNIHKISDECANSFGRFWLHNVREIFLLFIKFKFLWKNGVPEKIKAHLPQHTPPTPSITTVVQPPPL